MDAERTWFLGERPLAVDPASPVVGNDVRELQVLLDRCGYQLTCDGAYGPLTADRVREFQPHRGLRCDGIAGSLTVSELRRVRRLVTGGRPRYFDDRPRHDS